MRIEDERTMEARNWLNRFDAVQKQPEQLKEAVSSFGELVNPAEGKGNFGLGVTLAQEIAREPQVERLSTVRALLHDPDLLNDGQRLEVVAALGEFPPHRSTIGLLKEIAMSDPYYDARGWACGLLAQKAWELYTEGKTLEYKKIKQFLLSKFVEEGYHGEYVLLSLRQLRIKELRERRSKER